MAIKFQFNKTALGDLNKQLKVRLRALPTIKSKESALRVEVKKAKTTAEEYDAKLEALIRDYESMTRLWGEFDMSLVRVADVELGSAKIAGVKFPILKGVQFEVKPYSIFASPSWTTDGVLLIKQLAQLGIEREFYYRKMSLLEFSRKKTTQKVNLYEKVQIPGYQDAILKIKRYLEDEDNLSKASQKIVKARLESEEVGV